MLVLGIDRVRGLVEDDDGRVLEDRPGDGDPLTLTAREARPALLQNRVVPLRQGADEAVAARRLCRGDHLLVGGLGHAEAYVALDRVVEQVDVLKDHGDPRQQALGGAGSHVGAADRYPPRIDVPEPGDKVYQRRLARATRPHDRARAALRDTQTHVADHLATVPIAKTHVVELDAVAHHRKGLVRAVLFGDVTHLVDAVQLVADLLGEKRPVIRGDQLAVDHEGGHEEREGPRQGQGTGQAQGAGGKEHAATGQVEHERIELQQSLCGSLLSVVRRAFLLEAPLCCRQGIGWRTKRAQHRHAARILHHRVAHRLLGLEHPLRHRTRAPQQHAQNEQARHDARKRDRGDRRRHEQEPDAHDGSCRKTTREPSKADGHELLELMERGGERRGNRTKALLAEVAHRRALQAVGHAQTQIPENVEATGVHGDVDRVLHRVLPRHAHQQQGKALPDDIWPKGVAMLQSPEHRDDGRCHEERLEHVADHTDDEAAPRCHREAAGQVEYPPCQCIHSYTPSNVLMC